MLEFQHVPIKLTGIDSKTDDKNAIPGTFVTAENLEMHKNGKLQVRPGYVFPSSPVTHTSEIIGAIAYGDSNIAIQRNGTVYFNESTSENIVSSNPSYPNDKNLQTISFDTFITPISVTQPYSTTAGTSQDIVSYSQSVGSTYGLALITVYDGANVYSYYYYKYRLNSEIVERSGANSFTSTVFLPPQCIGDNYIVRLKTVSQLCICRITTTETVFNLTTTGGNLTKFDATESSNYIAVVHTSNAVTTTKLSLFNKSTDTETVATLSLAKTYDTLAISINAAQSQIIVAAGMSTGGANNIDIYVYNTSLVSVYAYSTTTSALNLKQYQIIEDPLDTTKLLLIYVNISIALLTGYRLTKATGVVSSTIGNFYNYYLSSKICYPYIVLKNNSDVVNCAYYLLDITQTLPVIASSFLYGSAIPYILFANNYELTHFNSTYVPLPSLAALSASAATNKLYSIYFNYTKYDITTNTSYMVNWNGSVITNAWGNLRIIDIPKSFYPLWASFPQSNPAVLLADDVTAGSLTPGGVYSYVAIYTAYDTNNNAIYSSPLYSTTHTTGGGITSINVGTKSSQNGFCYPRAQIALYRTENNGTVFYFLANIQTTFIDTISDANLLLNRALYTTGNIIDSTPAPTVKYMTIAKSRLWIVSPENNDQLFFSKKMYPGEAPQFNAVYTLLVQNIGGDLQAIAEMDDKLIIFRKNAVFVTFGDGPDELGNGAFTDPQLITMSLGCKYPHSIILNDKGLFFMSYEGIYMISRGLTLEYIGAAVEEYNSLTITQGLNLVDRHQLWFNSAEGRTLVHDDFYNSWYSFTNQPTYASFILNSDVPAHYRAISASKYPGRLMLESASVYYDGAVDNPITITLESGWHSFAGIQGFQRMRTFTFLGQLNDTATLKLYNDFESTENETFTILPATVGTSPAQYQVKPIRQKTQSIKYKITLASLSATFELSSLAIEAGLKRGTVRYDRSKRVSS